MKFSPHPYQMRAMKIMMQQASLGLFLDPGLGKTATWLASFVTLKELGMVESMLVVAPLSPMYGTWPTEIDKYDEFKHLTWCFLHGADKDWHLRNTKADVYLINPEGIQWLVDNCDPSKLADVICVDESTKFKNTASKRFKSMRRVFPRFRYRWIGTGTPSPNGLEDLFGQVYILDGGASLGKYITHFRNEHFYTEPWNPYKWIPKEGSLERITEKVAPLTLVMEAQDYLEMPELMVVDRSVTLPPGIQKLYDDIEGEFLGTIPDTNHALVAPSAAAAGAKCRQIANGAVYVEGETFHRVSRSSSRNFEELHDEKLDMLEELLEEIGEHPVLIVYEFQHDVRRISNRHADWPVLTGMEGSCRATMIKKFNEGEISRMLIQSSGGHGLNIQSSCHHMVWFGMTWNWEDYKQMVDRLYRQGQQSSMVMVYRILAAGTLDVEMARRLEIKRTEETHVKRAANENRTRLFGTDD